MSIEVLEQQAKREAAMLDIVYEHGSVSEAYRHEMDMLLYVCWDDEMRQRIRDKSPDNFESEDLESAFGDATEQQLDAESRRDFSYRAAGADFVNRHGEQLLKIEQQENGYHLIAGKLPACEFDGVAFETRRGAERAARIVLDEFCYQQL